MGKWWKRGSDSSMSGAYALNALDTEERAAFERYMTRSETLRAEVTEFGDTAALLSDAVDEVQPPEYLKTRIMAQIENTPQVSADQQLEEDVFSQRVTKTAQPRSARRGVFVGLATAFALVIVAGGGVAIYGQAQPAPVAQQATGITRIQTASDVQKTTVETARGEMQVIWSNIKGEAAIRNKDTLELPSDSTYQLWVTDAKGKTVSAGLLSSRSTTWTLFKQQIQHGDTLRMTVEPAGGSKQPTSKPVFAQSV